MVRSRPVFSGNGRWCWILVAVPTPVAFLHDVARLGQVGDHREGAAFGDPERHGDVPQPDTRIVGDATAALVHGWSGSSIRSWVERSGDRKYITGIPIPEWNVGP